MNADAYRAILDRLDLSQNGAAKLLGVNERTSRRWATGEREVTAEAERLLRRLLRARLTKQG